MAIIFTESADKHRIARDDALHAVTHATGTEVVAGLPGELTRVFVGHPHAQTDRYIEVMVAQRGTDFRVFHVMPLSDSYRHLASGRDDE